MALSAADGVAPATAVAWSPLVLFGTLLAALAAQPWRFDEVLIVDDGSADSSVALIRRRCPAARILELAANRGPAAACNAGFAAASCERILFIDNDVRLTGDAVRVLMETLDRNLAALVVAPRVVYEHAPRTSQYESADCHVSGMMIPRHADRPVEAGVSGPAVTGSLITACFLIDRGRWRGGVPFDESFGVNLEDHDFGLRATLSGHQLWVDPRAQVLHGTGTSGVSHRAGQAVPEARLFDLVRNRWFVLAKCFSRRTLVAARTGAGPDRARPGHSAGRGRAGPAVLARAGVAGSPPGEAARAAPRGAARATRARQRLPQRRRPAASSLAHREPRRGARGRAA